MSCTVDARQFEEFASGASDALLDHVATCETCQKRLEDSLSAYPGDVTESTMRAVRIDSAAKELAATVLDVGERYGKALAAYLVRYR